MRKHLSFLLTAFASFSAFAMAVADPQNLARDLKTFFPPQPSLEFVCNQPLKFIQNTTHCDMLCDQQKCRESCQNVSASPFQVEAEDCGTPTINVVSTLSWSVAIPTSSPQNFGQTWLEQFLSSLDYFIVPSGNFVLTGAEPNSMSTFVDDNGDETSIPTMIIFMDYVQAPGMSTLPYEVDLQMGKTGVEQILYFGDPDGKEYFIKRWGYLKWAQE